MFVQQWVNAMLFWFGGWLIFNSQYDYKFNDFLIAQFSILFGIMGLGAGACGRPCQLLSFLLLVNTNDVLWSSIFRISQRFRTCRTVRKWRRALAESSTSSIGWAK